MPFMLHTALFASSTSKRFHLSIDYCAKTSMQRTMRMAVAALALWVLMLLSATPSLAQASGTIHYPENGIDSRMRSDVQVDPLTHALQFRIPLGSYPGRGGASIPVTLSYSSKVWLLKHLSTVGGLPNCAGEPPNCIILPYDTVYGAQYAVESAGGWTSSLDWFKWPEGGPPLHYYTDRGEAASNKGTRRVARMFVRLPDGSKHELRRDDVIYSAGSSLPGTYYAVDGSRLRYETASMTLFMPDGSRYIGTSDYSTMSYVDRNGNTSTYTYSTGQWTDTLGRVINLPPLSANVGDSLYSLPGMNGSYTLRRRNLADVLTPDRTTGQTPTLLSVGDRTSHNTCTTVPSLFVSPDAYCGGDDDHRLMATAPFNPIVLSQIVLPTGQAYTFTYNVYGEIDKVVYPTGGYERFEHTLAPSLSAEFNNDAFSNFYAQANRGVDKRWVSAKGDGSDEALWQYTTSVSGNDFATEVTAPDGTRTERWLYRGLGKPADFSSGFGPIGFGFEDPRAGRAYDERVYAPNGQMMRRVLTEWTVDGTLDQNGFGYRMYKTRNPRVTKDVDIIFDTVGGGNALAKTTTMGYDGDLNVTATTESAYAEVDPYTAQTGGLTLQGQTYLITLPSGQVMRTSETDYALSGNGAYHDRQLIALPTASRVKDSAGNVIAQSSMSYDEPAYPLIGLGSITGWSDPATTTRGNVTTVGHWLNTTNTYLQTHAQYDSAGNVRNIYDALGNVSTVDYSATYQYAYPTSTTSAVPDPNNNHSSNQPLTSSTAYDYNTGLVTSTTDANGQVTSFQYNDPLNRLKRVDRPSGGGWTTYEYGRAAAGDYVHIQTAQDAATTLQSYQFFDGLGRAYRSFQYDPSGGATQWLTSDTQYDAMGRVWRVSANPYRSTGSDSAINPSGQWTSMDYDALGRAKNVTTADGAMVATQYSGNTVTVTDQAGKARKSVTDALGRLTQVIEDPTTGGFNYQTNYSYDALGNLRTVAQGQQTRTFVYDSLSRLTSATNPESDTLSYQYDGNGNLRFRTDARGTSTEYRYDNLNRNIITLYRVGGAPDPQTPDIERLYDRAGNGRGRAWLEWTWGTARSQTYIGAYDGMGRPTVRSESLADSLGWHNYDMSYAYDLAGNVTGITYPSGHTVSYTYDGAGRGQNFTGNLGDGAVRTYSSNTQYDDSGRLRQEQYGTQTPLYHKLHYNARGQLSDIRLSSVNDEWNWNRGAVVNFYSGNLVQNGSGADNNGNVVLNRTYVPANEAVSSYSFWQEAFTYDGLNRLQSVSEAQNGGSTSFVQTYAYDRYGNRTIDAGQTWGAGINNRQFSVDQATNRLGVPAGQQGALGYDAAGNLTTDTYTGAGGRIYDAENRMTTTTANGTPASWYVYDSKGKRVRRHDGTAEVWHVYGLSGELLAEYAAGTLSPQKEYGYRNGELLVIAGASTGGGTAAAAPSGLAASPAPSGANVTLSWGAATGAANYRVERKVAGGSFGLLAATASTTYGDTGVSVGSAYLYRLCAANASGICTSDYSNVALATLVGFTGSGFTDATIISFADDLTGATVTPVRAAHITELRQTVNAVRALASLPAAAWTNATVAPGATINADDVRDLRTKLDEALMALGIQTSAYADASLAGAPNGTQIKKIHITQLRERATRGSGAASSGGGGGTGQSTLQWLVNDQLGTPRMVVDQSGSLASVKRHDYLPFGEELTAGTGGRTANQGYGVPDNTRQGYTGYEKDVETGLNFAQNRYHSPTQGRFTSPDPLLESGSPSQPQSWNRYSYAINNPLKYTDPDGLRYVQRTLGDGSTQYGWCATDECYDNSIDKNAKGYAGWTAATFDESKSFEYTARGIGGNLLENYRLNPDGTNGYARILDGDSVGVTPNFSDQLAITSLVTGLFNLLGAGVDAAAGAATQRAATQATTGAAEAAGTWPGPGSGRVIVRGIEYTEHALERMAPRGLVQKGTEMISRGVPPSVVENAIQHGAKSAGNQPGTVVHTFENVRVVTNAAANRVITVITTGR